MAFVTIASFAQDRVSKPKVEFDKVSPVLTDVTGWSYYEHTGQWISNTGFISNNASLRDNKILKETAKMAKCKQNFENMQIKSLMLEGNRYYVLMYDYYYENRLNELSPLVTTSYTVFTEPEYEELLNIKKNEVAILESKVSIDGHYKGSNDAKVNFVTYFIKNGSGLITYYFKVLLTENEGEPVVRFILQLDQTVVNKYDFTNNYFEISEQKFDEFLELSSVD